jgi:hypothetical protein
MPACTAQIADNFAHLSLSDENAHTLKTQVLELNIARDGD